MNEQEQQEMQHLRAEWQEAGTFVWWWAEDYFIDRDRTMAAH